MREPISNEKNYLNEQTGSPRMICPQNMTRRFFRNTIDGRCCVDKVR